MDELGALTVGMPAMKIEYQARISGGYLVLDAMADSDEPVRGITTAHLTAIGEVALECGQLENMVQALLIDLAGLEHKKGRCITAHMPIRTICDSIEAVAGEIGMAEPLRLELQQMMSRAVQLVASRNTIVHAFWGASFHTKSAAGEATAIVIKARSKLSITHQNMTPHAISNIAESIRAHVLSVGTFRMNFLMSRDIESGI